MNKLFEWNKIKLDENRKNEINQLFEEEKNYELIFRILSEENYSDIIQFLQISGYIIKKIQTYLGHQKYTIIFDTTYTKLFNYYIKLVERACIQDLQKSKKILIKFCEIISTIRPTIIPSSRLSSFFLSWSLENHISEVLDSENNDADKIESLEIRFRQKMKNLNDYLQKKDDVLDIDYNYILFQVLCYYEISRYFCGSILGLYDIISNSYTHINNYFSEKELTNRIIKRLLNRYQSKITKPISGYIEYLKDINFKIRNYAAHRAFDPLSENYEIIDNRLLDNGEKMHANQLLLNSFLLYSFLKLKECWNYIILIEIKSKFNENYSNEILSLRNALYNLYCDFRPTIRADSQYLMAKGTIFEKELFKLRLDSYFFR